MGMKGQIPILEMIAVTIILFVSFSILFPQNTFANRWSDADLVLTGRDAMITMDRTGSMGTFTSDPSALSSFLTNIVPLNKSLIYWTTLDGTVQSKITVACNCTTQQVDSLLNWIGKTRINGRDIQFDILQSSLSPIQDSDVLLIWGNTNLSPYRTDLLTYLNRGNGIVAIADATNPDPAYTELFGVKACSSIFGNGNSCKQQGNSNQNTFVVPAGTSQSTYQAYKMFDHIPIRTNFSFVVAAVPFERDVTPCVTIPVFQGTFSIKSTDSTFWICNTSSVYFDTNGNSQADIIVGPNDTFSIAEQNLKMNYIDLNKTFISFRPGYSFDEMRSNQVSLYPADQDASKILLQDGTYRWGGAIPVVVANGSSYSRTMWGVDFLSGSNTGHDRRQLIASMLLSSSNKRSKSPVVGSLQFGALTQYVNVVNKDMLEIYQFGLGIGFPF